MVSRQRIDAEGRINKDLNDAENGKLIISGKRNLNFEPQKVWSTQFIIIFYDIKWCRIRFAPILLHNITNYRRIEKCEKPKIWFLLFDYYCYGVPPTPRRSKLSFSCAKTPTMRYTITNNPFVRVGALAAGLRCLPNLCQTLESARIVRWSNQRRYSNILWH